MSNEPRKISQDERAMSLQPGTVVAGRYEIVRCLGYGSVGVVYSCFHRDLPDRCFAVKFLHKPSNENSIDETSLLGRFRNELMAAYQVNHPNVVRAFDYIEEDGLLGFTMEHVSGGDLWEMIRSHDTLSLKSVVDILSQICTGVQAIHEVGIVHRDLKPENILVAEDGTLKITDFGIARIRNGKHFTAQGGVVGTFDYLSPEYLKDSECDERSDIFSIGIIGYLLLTGQSPFSNKSLVESIMSRIECAIEPPHALNPKCPATLSAVILKALEPEPGNRYQTASEMLYHLAALRFSIQRDLTAPAEATQGQHGSGLLENLEESLTEIAEPQFNSDKRVKKAEMPLAPRPSFTRVRPVLGSMAIGFLSMLIIAIGYPVVTHGVPPSVTRLLKTAFPGLQEENWSEEDTATQRKATLLYKFVNHLSARAESENADNDSVVICIIGSDPFGSYIDRITSRTRTISNQRYLIQRITDPDSSEKTLKRCTLAYVNSTEERTYSSALKSLENANILVISDGSGTGTIDFVKDKSGQVTFRVDPSRSRSKGMGVSPALLELSEGSPSTIGVAAADEPTGN